VHIGSTTVLTACRRDVARRARLGGTWETVSTSPRWSARRAGTPKTTETHVVRLITLVPFEANLRTGCRAPRRLDVVVADPDPTWPEQADRLIGRLRFSVGGQLIRVDHIGSTSVPGLPAKQLIDIQVVVADLAAAARAAEAARRAGFVHVPGQWFGADQHGVDHPQEVAADADPGRPVNINIRPVTAPVSRETLLFRDWLRSHAAERDAYAVMKRELAQRPGHNVDDYGKDKMPWISAALGRAEDWAVAARWSL
jgi:GrpB-like predicted nucleotidyltransferase (UPF0157 family)